MEEHKKNTLIKWRKEDLIDYILILEKNIKTIEETFEIQYKNAIKLLNQMNLVNKTYIEAKEIIEKNKWSERNETSKQSRI